MFDLTTKLTFFCSLVIGGGIWLVVRFQNRRERRQLYGPPFATDELRWWSPRRVFKELGVQVAMTGTLVVLSLAFRNLGGASKVFIRVVGGTLFVAALAIILFALKHFLPRVYAVIEITFALALTATVMFRMGDRVEYLDLLTVVASCYFVVRGLDNFKKALEERAARQQGTAKVPLTSR